MGLNETTNQLVPFPATALRVVELATGDHPDPAGLAALIAGDPALLAEVLRRATPEGAKDERAPATLAEAMAALGDKGSIHVAVILVSGRHLLQDVPVPGLARAAWSHSIATGILARELASPFGADPEACGTWGALTLIGRLARLRREPEAMAEVDERIAAGLVLEEAERQGLGATSYELSALLSRSMDLPGALTACLEDLAGHCESPEARTLAAAAGLATLLGYPSTPADPGRPLDPEVDRWLEADAERAPALAEAVEVAVAAMMPEGHQDESPMGLDHDLAVETVLSGNQSLARLQTDYAGAQREIETREKEIRDMAATFASLTLGLDGEAIGYSILESLLEYYRVPIAFLVKSAQGRGRMDGTMFRLRDNASPGFDPLTLDLGRLSREAREGLLQGQSMTLPVDGDDQGLHRAVEAETPLRLAPLMVRGTCTGVLGVALPPEDAEAPARGEFLNIIATAAALALDNARLYADILRKASVDPLTGVSNRRIVLERLEQLAGRGADVGRGFAVALVDLDNFKAVNDTLGHQAGDRYLRDVVSALKDVATPEDQVGRYGGDEFLILMGDLSADETRERADALRSAVAVVGRQPRWRGVGARLGATIGLAWSREAVADASQLVALADCSLYEAKALGKNRIGTVADASTAPGGAR